MPIERVVPLKVESASFGGDAADEAFYPTPANVNEDALETRGSYFQNDTSRDASVYITRDASHNLIFRDSVVGVEKTLSQLVAPTTASQIANVPAGNLVATNVQSALNELQGDIDVIYSMPGIDGYVAGEALTQFHAVRMNTSGQLVKAQADGFENSEVVGFAGNTYTLGQSARALINGAVITPIKEGSETWAPRDLIFLSATTPGTVTKIPPAGINKALLAVGVAKSNTQMTVKIAESIILA